MQRTSADAADFDETISSRLLASSNAPTSKNRSEELVRFLIWFLLDVAVAQLIWEFFPLHSSSP